MTIIDVIYKFIVFPGFLFTALLGLISSWVDRKVTARVQWRVGPPWYQPIADVIKLFGKENIIPEGSLPFLFVLSPIVGFAGVILVSTMLWIFNIDVKSTFVGDLIVVLYLLLLPSLSIILGGFASGSPLASSGASREMKLILAYELPFIIAVFTVVAKAGSILMGDIINYQMSNGMMITHPSCMVAFIVVLLSSQAKLALVPFDIPEAEQEIAGGPFVEYSGSLLAIFKLTKAMLLATLPILMITLFFGGIDLSTNIGLLYFVLKYVMVVALFTLIRNTNPRLRIDQAVKFFWGPALALAVLGFILTLFGV